MTNGAYSASAYVQLIKSESFIFNEFVVDLIIQFNHLIIISLN